ncbi:hypothetical protein PSHT_01592 [Puccinia striiformis]|uniref:Uncharacterized protein n=1 Tax=Puccinia striiformis TaxID=27350 RepID=A0A2S4WK93_9BASI|nr:hypothetical protein PSHT_01592 [Puccinia striiformis]
MRYWQLVYHCYYTGFGLCGTPDTLIKAVAWWPEIKNLTLISNNAGIDKSGLALLWSNNQGDWWLHAGQQ